MSKAKQNHPGYGTEYEIYVPAYVALKLNQCEEVSDFCFRSNSKEFGNIDDVVLDITFTNGAKQYFALQLKHKGNKNKVLSPAAFESANNNFSLTKYCLTFRNLKPEIKNKYHFIIYTNSKINANLQNELKNFTMNKAQDHTGQKFFDTSNNSDGNSTIYKFALKNVPLNTTQITKDEYRDFFSKLTLYTCQKNFEDLEKDMLLILGSENVFQNYIGLFRKWHQGRFTNKTIDRTTVDIHLIDMFLWTYNTDHYFFSPENRNMNLFHKAVHEFDVTLLNDNNIKQDLTTCKKFDSLSTKRAKLNFNKYTKKYACKLEMKKCMLRLAKDYNFVEKTSNELNETIEKKIYFYFFENLLVINFNEKSEETIYQLMKLYKIKKDRIKFVLLGRHKVNFNRLPGLDVFQNLENISLKNKRLCGEIITACKISLQGRSEISLKQLSDEFEEITSLFKTKDIIKMLKDRLLIGEEKISTYHIQRRVSTVLLDRDTLLKLYKSERDAVYIIKLDNKLKNQFQQEVEVKDINNYLENAKDFKQKSVILLVDEDFDEAFFENIFKENLKKSVHFFRSLAGDKYVLVRSTSPIIHKMESTTQQIFHEDEIHSVFNNPVNILIAEPGMGKSTMLNYLGIKCPWDFWAINENLKDHYRFFNKKRSAKCIRKYFVKTNNNIFLKAFVRHRKIIFFLDGLDEIPSSYVENVLDGIEKISRMGFRVWVSSRPNLQKQLLQRFNIFSISILELDKEQQEKYVQDRLEDNNECNEEKIKEVMKHIFTSVNIVNNLQILGIPLQLYIITEILLSNKKFRITENFFVLTKLYKYFFEGRYRHCAKKSKCKHPCPFIHDCSDYLEQYETLALQTLFENDFLQMMNIDLRNHQKFISKIKTDGDPLGIVKKLDGQKGVFEHNTYAEYFAAIYLSKNFDKSRILKKYLFLQKYSNVLLMLNIKLCEQNPLQLAIVHKNFEEIEKHIKDERTLDEGGRNPLHVAMGLSNCVSLYPEDSDIIDPFETIKFTTRHLSAAVKREIRQNENLIGKLIMKFDPYESDRLFGKNCLHYAILQGNLFAIEIILENFGMSHEVYNDLKNYKFINNPNVAYYSVLQGYPNLLAVSVDRKHSKVVKIIEDSFESNTLSHFALQCDLKKKYQVAHLLMDYGLSESVYQNAILHLSVQNNDLQFTKALLEEDASANLIKATDATTRNTVLHLAVKEKNTEIVKLLLENGCNVKAVNNLNEQPKHLAIQNQHLEILQMLLCSENSVDVDYYHQIMLHCAVETTNVEIINYVLRQNVDVNYQDEYGKTALHIAAEMGNYQSFKILAQKEPDFDIKTKNGLTVLHCAILGNNTDIIKTCLEHEQIINIPDDKGEPPLFYAIRKGSIQVVKLLLDKEAAIHSISTFEEDTPLHVACATCTDSCEIIQLLLDKNVKIDAKNKKEETPLIVASRQKNVNFFRVLLDNGADITKISTSGINIWSFLSNLQTQKHKDTINLILEKGANPNLDIISVDPLGETANHGTPLSKAIANNCWDVVEKLLQYEAKIQDLFALKEALRNKAYLERLQQKGLHLTIFDKEHLSRVLMQIILYEQHPEGNMQLYVDNKLNINVKHEKGDTSLHLAVALGKYHIAKWLLQNMANVNAINSKEETALHVAVANEQLDMVHLLLKNGADINCCTKQNDAIWESLCRNFPADCEKIILNAYPNLKVFNRLTPLYYAVDNNNENLTQRLIEKGADINDSRAFKKAVQRNNISIIKVFLERDCQPLDTKDKEIMPLAGSIGNCNVIDLLLRWGFKINSTNNSGETALYLAAKNKHFLAAKLLILREADVNCSSRRGETFWDYLEEYDRSLTDLILKKGATELGLNISNQNSLLHYAIRSCDEILVKFLLKSEVPLDFDDPSLKAEAILRKNANILQALENRGFKTTAAVLEKVVTCLVQRRNVEVLSLMEEDYGKSETDGSSLYKLLHLAVYMGNEERVEFVFKTKIDLDSVDTYNSLYPLHFAAENGVLKQELLMEMTRWINREYEEEKLWKVEDMREHILQRYPLDRFDFRRKHKYSYLTEKIENTVPKTMEPPLESRFSVLNGESCVKTLERSISVYVNYWLNTIKNVAFRRTNSLPLN